jgi:hypothetical protein
MNGDFEKGMPRLSVRGAGAVVVGECAACESGPVMLGWRERDLGLICRQCAVVLIEAELGRLFPKKSKKEE